MNSDYDLVVIGGVPGGAIAAKTTVELVLKTVIIEKGLPSERRPMCRKNR